MSDTNAYISDDTGRFYRVDPNTLAITLIGSQPFLFKDVGVAPDGTLYGVTDTQLYRIDKTTGATTFVADLSLTHANSFAFSPTGEAYISQRGDDNLYRLNVETGETTLVGSTGLGFGGNGDLAFLNGDLYLAHSGGGLAKLDPQTGEAISDVNIPPSGIFAMLATNGRLIAFLDSAAYFVDPTTGALTLAVDYPNSEISSIILGATTDGFGQTGIVVRGDGGSATHNGSSLDDVVFGFGGADSLIGGNGNDFLVGGLGVDTMVGGEGNDVLVDGFGNGNYQGGGGWDRAHYTIASGGATIVRNADGSATISGAGFTDTLTGVEAVRFTDKVVALRERADADLTGDGTSDIVWYNASNGATNYFTMAGGSIGSWDSAGAVNTGWSAVASGDLDGDGGADILFRRAGDGAIGYLTEDNGSWSWHGTGAVSPGWSVAGVGDLNGDGREEIVYSNAAIGGAVGTFDTSTQTWVGIGVVDPTWSVVGIADVDGDTKDEVVYFDDAAGKLGTLDANGHWQALGTAVGANWDAVATGDFNGDGTSDVLMVNAGLGNALNYWATDAAGSAQWAGFAGLGPIGSDWTVAGTGNYNGDAFTDILIYNANLDAVGVIAPTATGGITWTGLGAVDGGWQIL